MKVVLAFGILCLCGWTVHSVSAQGTDPDPFLNKLNKSKDNDTDSESDKERRRKLREEITDDMRKEREALQQKERDFQRRKEQEDQQKRTAGASTPTAAVLALPVVQATNPNTISQRNMIPNNQQGYQQQGYQQPQGTYTQPQAAPAPQQQQLPSPSQLLSSGFLSSILSPQIPAGQGGSSLIPPLVSQGLKDSMEKQRATLAQQQQGQQPGMYQQPMMDARQMYPQMGMNNLGYQPQYGMQNSAIPGFGTAMPAFGNTYPQSTQGYVPQASMVQPMQQMPLNNYGTGVNPGLMGGLQNGGLMNTNVPMQTQGLTGFTG